MRRNFLAGGAAALLLLPMAALAEGGDAAAVVAANAAFDAALSRRDVAALEGMWLHAPHVIAIHPAGKTPQVGWDAVRKSWVETCERFSELTVELPEPKVWVTGDTARVVGIETIRGTVASGGAKVDFLALTTNLYERHGGRWLMVLHHASRAPA